MKKVLFIVLALFSTMGYSKEKVKKYRDRIRLNGYAHVRVEITCEVVDGVTTVIRKDIFCEGAGEMKCKDQNVIAPGTELDFTTDYTPAEKSIAQNLIVLGDNDIDQGIASGTKTGTYQFYDTVQGVYYFRTFRYTWVTNALSEVSSVLDISDKF